MTEHTLEKLTHEQLIQIVTERLGETRGDDSVPSLYLRSPNVPVVKIHPYPKRRRSVPLTFHLEPIRTPSLPEDVTYADFLRDPEAAPLRAAV